MGTLLSAPAHTTSAVTHGMHCDCLRCHPCPHPHHGSMNKCAAEQVLVELAIEREQDIPALIYEGRSRAVSSHGCVERVCFPRRRASSLGCSATCMLMRC